MSTKIFNTYYLDKSLFETFSFLKELQPRIIELSKQIFCEYIANIYCDYHDSCLLGYPDSVCERYQISSTSGNFEDFSSSIDVFLYKNENSNLRKDIDFKVEVCAFPLSPTETIIQFFTGNNNIGQKISKIMEDKKIPSFDYYNNADPPEEFTDEEWDERGKIWDKLLPTGIPVNDSFTFLMVNYSVINKELDFYIKFDDIKSYIKPAMERAKEIVKDEILALIVTEKLHTEIKITSIMKASEILKTDDHYNKIWKNKAKVIYEKIK